ncbi:MAG TPA: choice-of-anchor D domain-containing protein [Terracidiphilus sp.]|nr:choice-of-anchor D domain-containing protein [Terracidiphilus sp.]
MKTKRSVAFCALLALAFPAWGPARARQARIALAPSPDFESIPQPGSRIVEPIDESRLVTLHGNVHPLARPQYDRGMVDSQLMLERMQLVLRRSPEQEAALEKRLADLYDPKSPLFHHWLTPEEFGRLYGPSDADIARVTSWLENHGFTIYLVTKGRTDIEFSGTADQVRQAFHTEIHRYLVRGEEHIANSADPQIPAALAPVIYGVASLHNFFPQSQAILGRYVKRNRKTGKITPLESIPSRPSPQYGFTDQYGDAEEDITPADFATIYNLNPLWKAGTNGKGVKIAISAVTDIYQQDINVFRSDFGLPATTVQVIHNGADPGVDKNSLPENTLDTQWSGAAAPGATLVLVVSGSTKTAFGGDLSNSYIVNHPSIASVTSASYGLCEPGLGNAGNKLENDTAQQGAAVGISMFVSSGDQGSTGCDSSDTPAPNPAQYGLQVNGWASTPWITGVGGTDFAWQSGAALEGKALDPTNYWNSTNTSTGGSAKGYMPEIPWNSTCASKFLFDNLFSPSYSAASIEAVCNDTGDFGDFLKITGGSGGKSSCKTINGSTLADCAGGYAKPSWQKGLTPGDAVRDVPDVSLFASGGYPDGVQGSAYLLCVTSNSPNDNCTTDYGDPDSIIYQEVGGTSVSSPAMAGIMALVVQKTGSNQGLANPVLYQLAGKENFANCDSDSGKVTNSGACIFNDITYGNNVQPCTAGTPNCNVNSQGDQYGIVSGYNSAKGYDYTTGLGSVNAYNLVHAWPASTTQSGITLTPNKLTFPNTATGTTSDEQSVTVKNTGTSSVTLHSISITGANPASFVQINACPASLAAGKSCTVFVAFRPAAAAAEHATLSVSDTGSGSPQTATLSGTGTARDSVTLSATKLTFPSTAKGTFSAAQSVTVSNKGGSILDIAGISITGAGASSFLELDNCGPTLAPGASCTVVVAFQPTRTGAITATIDVTDNGNHSPQTVALTGTGH